MKTIVFYSYKGGTGRSLLLANYARYLALCGRRVFILDCDLEAPGLHHKFAAAGMFDPQSGLDGKVSREPLRGLVDYIPKRIASFSVDVPLELTVPESLDDYVAELRFNGGSTVFFMPAGRAPQPSYAQSVLGIEWKQLFPPWNPKNPMPAPGVSLFGDLKERIAETYNPAFLLIDSRTGITDIGSVVVRHLADSFVCVFLNNLENIEGTKAIIRSLRNSKSLDPIAPEILPVFARVPNESRRQVDDLITQVRLALEDALDGLPLYLLHEEDSLHVAEELLFGSHRALGESTLLRDYLRLFVALDQETAEQSKYASLLSYLSRLDASPASHHSDARPRIEILTEVGKRSSIVLRHAGKHAGNANVSKYKATGYGYVAGNEYAAFASTVLRDLLKRARLQVPDLHSEEEPVDEEEINWDLLSVQIGTRFDFSSEPYYLTRYRSLFLDVVPLGYVKTFTAFLVKDSALHRAIADCAGLGIGPAVRSAKADPDIEVCLMGESAAADEAARAISPFIHGSALNFRREAKGLWAWLTSDQGVGPERRVVICDHSVAAKLAEFADNGSRYVFSRNGADVPELTFKCYEDIPTGLLFPAGDRGWRYLINQAVATSVDEKIWGAKELHAGVAKDLWDAGIDPFSWDELKTNLVLGMKPDDAETWIEHIDRSGTKDKGGPTP